jgi:hypothetical protein
VFRERWLYDSDKLIRDLDVNDEFLMTNARSPKDLLSMNLKKIGVFNLLLVFVPVALILEFSGASDLWVFVTSGIAIIPLAGLMSKSTEMLAHRLGPGIGGLLNASFGNAAELITDITVHPTNAYLVSWMARILSWKNSWSL